MPKCYDCKKDAPLLTSITRLTANPPSVALCNECLRKDKEKSAKK